METFKINIKEPLKSISFFDIETLEKYNDNSYKLKFNGNIKNLAEGQSIYYIRNLSSADGLNVFINERGIIEDILTENEIVISIPNKKVYKVVSVNDCIINEVDNVEKVPCKRITLNIEHNIFQQDLDECVSGGVYNKVIFYDKDFNEIGAKTEDKSFNFNIPFRYMDIIPKKEDCLEEYDILENCEECNVEIFKYNFIPLNLSRKDIIIKKEDIDDAKKENFNEDIKYVMFKYDSFSYEDKEGNIQLFSDKIWGENFNDEKCTKFIKTNNSVQIGYNTSFYNLNIGLSIDADDTKLGDEDTFNTKFIEDLKESLIPQVVDMERIKYIPSINNGISAATEIEFYLHFIRRKEIDEDKRYLNSSYTSGNVYYDTWHVDPDNRETIWWNDYNYTGNTFIPDDFETFDKENGYKSDLIGYLNFTDADVYYRKKKISQSFLRLSFYNSKDPVEQKLLYYSTIFLDGGELYGKYIKQLSNLKDEIAKNSSKGTDRINENAFVSLYPGETRVDSKLKVTHEYDKSKSSEGFNLYLFNDDYGLDIKDKTIYMKIEFNHAGNGKTTPLILWPKKDGEYCPLTTDNFIDSLYTEVKLHYNDEFKRYMYSFPNAEISGNSIMFKLYEPKLDLVDDKLDDTINGEIDNGNEGGEA